MLVLCTGTHFARVGPRMVACGETHGYELVPLCQENNGGPFLIGQAVNPLPLLCEIKPHRGGIAHPLGADLWLRALAVAFACVCRRVLGTSHRDAFGHFFIVFHGVSYPLRVIVEP